MNYRNGELNQNFYLPQITGRPYGAKWLSDFNLLQTCRSSGAGVDYMLISLGSSLMDFPLILKGKSVCGKYNSVFRKYDLAICISPEGATCL